MTKRETYQQFLRDFPYDTLRSMTLEQYTNDKTSFCYALDVKTSCLGEIRGSSSFKFGIYRFKSEPSDNVRYRHDLSYAWNASLGEDSQSVFRKIRSAVCSIATFARAGTFDKIDTVLGLHNMVRWKIAFLYSDEKLIPIYKKEMLVELVSHFGMGNAEDASQAELNAYLIEKKGKRDIFTFYDELLSVHKELGSTLRQAPADKPRYWIYSPGESASKWERCQSDGIACIGWDEIGDLSGFDSLEGMRKAIQDAYDKQYSSCKNDARAVWDFSHVMKPGDIIFAKQGQDKLLGRGIVMSDYSHDESYDDFNNIRKVDWKQVGTWDAPCKSATKTLTDLTLYPDYVSQLEDVFRSCEKYDRALFLSEVYMSAADYDNLEYLLRAKKNVILQGAPGVGKTYSAKRLAYSIMGKVDDSVINFVQFHQNYSYEDFVEGYKPNQKGGFDLRGGIFYNACLKARNDPKHDYFFIIDEINRGNLSKIFGELLMLIEKDYRGMEVKLAYGGELFSVPENLYIIGMMNTADRSLAMIDYALRRRFSFFEVRPGFDSEGFRNYQKSLNRETFDKVIDGIKTLNRTIERDSSLGCGFCIGHSYFCGQKSYDGRWLRNVIEYDIKPMLKEYWFDDSEKADSEIAKLEALLQ